MGAGRLSRLFGMLRTPLRVTEVLDASVGLLEVNFFNSLSHSYREESPSGTTELIVLAHLLAVGSGKFPRLK